MPTILALQILRAVAAVAVVLVHAGIDLSYFGHTNVTWTTRGNAGVDLFFVVSGFVMVYIASPQFGKREAPVQFFVRRLIRIVPLYWLLTTGYIVAKSYPLAYIAASYLFIPAARPNGVLQPVILQGWTLTYEMFFYLLFAIAILLRRRAAV